MRHPYICVIASALCASTALAFQDDFSTPLDADRWSASSALPGARITCPVSDPQATDGQALELLYPGTSSPRRYGPRWATEIETLEPHGYGRYQARFKTGAARSREGVVSAFFTYFNDGTDYDDDGIIDNSEIDFEFLAAEPSMVYLTVWTDYQDLNGVETFYHTSRKVDLATGLVWQTAPGFEGQYGHLEPVTPLDWSLPGFDASKSYRTYAFDWQPDRVTFQIDAGDGAGPRTLWSFVGQPDVSVPSLEAYAMLNLWHNNNAWDTGLPAAPPVQAVTFRVDKVSIP